MNEPRRINGGAPAPNTTTTVHVLPEDCSGAGCCAVLLICATLVLLAYWDKLPW